jgi:transcriptional regulator CtsR
MIKPKSSVRFIALGAAENWEDAISMARNSLGVLRTSTSKGMFASQSKFAAVLTSEGNLAVIQISEHDANKGTIYGWVEKIPAWIRSFGPVIERVINDNGEEKNWLIDFETGRLFSPSTETRSDEVFSRWITENRIDAMGETRTSSPGLYGFEMEAIPIAAETWETISPKGLADALSIAKSGIRTVMSAKGKLPLTYTFKTREGGMGVVQILQMQYKKKPRFFRIRYKMLQRETQNTAIANSLSVSEAFLAAAVSGRDSEAIRLVKPGSAVAVQVKDFQKIYEKDKLKVVSVYGDEEAALAITTEVRVGPDEKGQLSIRLIKQRGNWMVEDVDCETPASLKIEIDSFLQRHPNATKLQ